MTLTRAATAAIQGAVTWVDGSVLSSPADTTTLADTGTLTAGNYLISVSVATDSAAAFTVAVRQLDVSLATVHSQIRRVAAGSNDDWLFGNKIPLSASDRIRVLLSNGSGVTGNVQASLFIMECG